MNSLYCVSKTFDTAWPGLATHQSNCSQYPLAFLERTNERTKEIEKRLRFIVFASTSVHRFEGGDGPLTIALRAATPRRATD